MGFSLNRLWKCLSGTPEREAHEKLLQAMQLGLVNMALVNFSKALVAKAREGNGLHQDELVRIKADCIACFHNYGARGLSIQDEAFVLNSALEVLGAHLDQI